MSLLNKEDIHKTTFNLLKESMEQNENVKIFTARITEKYSEFCNLYGVQALPVSLNHVIACTVTSNMNPTGKALYWDNLREDAKQTVTEMEKSLRDISFRKSLFENTNMQVNPGDQNISSVYATDRSRVNHNHYRTYRRPKCWFFQRGTCKFGMMPNGCRYEHI